MDKQISVDLILLLRGRAAQRELGQALWAAFQEVGLFYNLDQQRAMFRRFYLSEREPDSETLEFLREARGDEGDPAEGKLWWQVPPTVWDETREGSRRTYNAGRIARLVPTLLDGRQADNPIIVIDQELTPPKDWRYILWERGVISIAPMDPLYWGAKEPNRIAIIKHRVRATCLLLVGRLLGQRRCGNERCFMYSNVDSVMRLDGMVTLGEEHTLPPLVGLGFEVLSSEPKRVQQPVTDPGMARRFYER